MALLSVFMDVEDPINPLADDAALDFAQLFTDVGIRGSFCVTGEKCRKLLERGREDVIEALLPHCLGLHTDTHSYHPTTMELLADVDYEAGCGAAFATESRGLEAFRRAFGRTPSFWGGAGNTWSPEICDALARMGVPALAYCLTEIPKQRVHRFNGVLALPQSHSLSEAVVAEHAPFWTPPTAGWTGLFAGHPTRYRYPDYWDRSYYLGKSPYAPDLMEPAPEETYRRAKRNLTSFLQTIGSRCQIVGVDELARMPWSFRKPTAVELDHFRLNTPLRIREAGRWPIHRPDLNVQGIVDKTLALADTLEVAELA